MKRILVCGGREYANKARVREVLLDFDPLETILITGGASGADSLACEHAKSRSWPHVVTFLAEWEQYGKRAGPLRNQRMLDLGVPELVIAFPGGAGTADMVARAKKAGIPVREIEE